MPSQLSTTLDSFLRCAADHEDFGLPSLDISTQAPTRCLRLPTQCLDFGLFVKRNSKNVHFKMASSLSEPTIPFPTRSTVSHPQSRDFRWRRHVRPKTRDIRCRCRLFCPKPRDFRSAMLDDVRSRDPSRPIRSHLLSTNQKPQFLTYGPTLLLACLAFVLSRAQRLWYCAPQNVSLYNPYRNYGHKLRVFLSKW